MTSLTLTIRTFLFFFVALMIAFMSGCQTEEENPPLPSGDNSNKSDLSAESSKQKYNQEKPEKPIKEKSSTPEIKRSEKNILKANESIQLDLDADGVVEEVTFIPGNDEFSPSFIHVKKGEVTYVIEEPVSTSPEAFLYDIDGNKTFEIVYRVDSPLGPDIEIFSLEKDGIFSVGSLHSDKDFTFQKQGEIEYYIESSKEFAQFDGKKISGKFVGEALASIDIRYELNTDKINDNLELLGLTIDELQTKVNNWEYGKEALLLKSTTGIQSMGGGIPLFSHRETDQFYILNNALGMEDIVFLVARNNEIVATKEFISNPMDTYVSDILPENIYSISPDKRYFVNDNSRMVLSWRFNNGVLSLVVDNSNEDIPIHKRIVIMKTMFKQ